MAEEKPKLFETGQTVYYDGEEMKVIAEYDRTIVAEFIDFPLVGKEEEFPYNRIVLLKNEVS
ncbi:MULTISPECIES: hypothetical protein [Bacillaceae]|uniref:hypothetical protein n=1 Tax=Bacillaceae TaxID=186817 RepID=UPI0006D17A34|nr:MULTISPECIES: hypothetical protein [Bacillaceae]